MAVLKAPPQIIGCNLDVTKYSMALLQDDRLSASQFDAEMATRPCASKPGSRYGYRARLTSFRFVPQALIQSTSFDTHC